MSSLEQQIAEHGRDPIALSTTQPGLSYLQTPAGFIAYQRAFGSALSLGGPVCAAEHEEALAREYLRKVRGGSLFYVEDSLAFAKLGLTFRASLGSDRVLELERDDTFSSVQVKSAVRKAQRAGLELEELDARHARAADFEAMEKINEAALRKSVVPFEMRFLNRPMDPRPSLSRVFFLSQRGERFGYAVLDPYFERGAVKGYLLNLIRFGPTSIWGVYMAVVHALSQRLLAEGTRELSLGFCPLGEVDLEHSSALFRPQLRWLVRKFASADYFNRLRTMKSQFEGRWVRRWLVTKSPQLLTPMLSFLKLTGVPVGGWLREQLGLT